MYVCGKQDKIVKCSEEGTGKLSLNSSCKYFLSILKSNPIRKVMPFPLGMVVNPAFSHSFLLTDILRNSLVT